MTYSVEVCSHDRARGWANIVQACYACSHALLSHSPPRFMCHGVRDPAGSCALFVLHRNSVGKGWWVGVGSSVF